MTETLNFYSLISFGFGLKVGTHCNITLTLLVLHWIWIDYWLIWEHVTSLLISCVTSCLPGVGMLVRARVLNCVDGVNMALLQKAIHLQRSFFSEREDRQGDTAETAHAIWKGSIKSLSSSSASSSSTCVGRVHWIQLYWTLLKWLNLNKCKV